MLQAPGSNGRLPRRSLAKVGEPALFSSHEPHTRR